MLIQQTLTTPITINRFDTGESITFIQNVPIDVDDDTASYLLGHTDENGVHPPMLIKETDGNDVVNFKEVT